MFLGRALNNISNITSSIGRQKVLAETLKDPEKLAKTLLRIEFLTACRKAKVRPRFIGDALKPVVKVFGDNAAIVSRCRAFSSSLPNEAIAEAFRKKAFQLRQRDRQLTDIHSFLNEGSLPYVQSTCSEVFEKTAEENRPRLIRKYRKC